MTDSRSLSQAVCLALCGRSSAGWRSGARRGAGERGWKAIVRARPGLGCSLL